MRFFLCAGCLVVVMLSLCSVNYGPTVAGKQAQAKAQIANFYIALDSYRHDVGDYPATVEGLAALRVGAGHRGWNGPYMPQDIPLDPWGQLYRYVYDGGKPVITASR